MLEYDSHILAFNGRLNAVLNGSSCLPTKGADRQVWHARECLSLKKIMRIWSFRGFGQLGLVS
jgi:hypothetical protein